MFILGGSPEVLRETCTYSRAEGRLHHTISVCLGRDLHLPQAWIKTCPCQGIFFYHGIRGWKETMPILGKQDK